MFILSHDYFNLEFPFKLTLSNEETASLMPAREFKSRVVTQAPVYVIVHSLLELSFCTQPFPTPSGWFCRCVLTLVMALCLWRSINFVLFLLFLTLGRYNPEGV